MITVYFVGNKTLQESDERYIKLCRKFSHVDLLHRYAVSNFRPSCTADDLDILLKCNVRIIAVDGFEVSSNWLKECERNKISFIRWNNMLQDWEKVA